jgi:nucleoside-diphosphate-sugar epimerase
MRVLITGESGFIAQNLAIAFSSLDHDVVYIEDSNVLRLKKTGEVCVHRNSSDAWQWHLKNLDIDIIVHNAAVVGTDVVALNPNEATLTNVVGSYNLARASKTANVPICYMGTTVIYDTPKYQNKQITEESKILPMTFYGSQKLAGEHVIVSHANDWLVMRPLFAYGGVGDMNSLIAKTIYAHLNNHSEIDMFLNPNMIKDYLYVEDFCKAVVHGCIHMPWGSGFNVAAETPYVTLEIVNMISDVVGADVNRIIKWHPETDYLGNHMLSSKKFKSMTSWRPKISLKEGIQKVYDAIVNDKSNYDPLVHLNRAKGEGVNLAEFYNSGLK